MKVELKKDGTILITAMTVAEGFALKGLANNKVAFDLSILGCPMAEAVGESITDDKTEFCFDMNDIHISKWTYKTMGAIFRQSKLGVKVYHRPTNTEATCCDFKSQHMNRHMALVRLDKILRST